MKRIIVIGNGGTGKSTLGEVLAKKLSLPVYHLDQFSWKPGWQRVPEEEFRRNLSAVLATPEWIVEGWAYHSTMRQRFEAADVIIYLAYPVWFAYYGATKRYVQYYFRQNPYDPPNSLRRNVLWLTYKAMWRVYKSYEPDVHAMIEEFREKKRIIVLHSRGELRAFLQNIE